MSVQRGVAEDRRTHSVPFRVPKYFIIWSKIAALEATNPASALLSLLVTVL